MRYQVTWLIQGTEIETEISARNKQGLFAKLEKQITETTRVVEVLEPLRKPKGRYKSVSHALIDSWQ